MLYDLKLYAIIGIIVGRSKIGLNWNKVSLA